MTRIYFVTFHSFLKQRKYFHLREMFKSVDDLDSFCVITNRYWSQLNIINWRQICHNIFDAKHTTNLLSLRINGNITTCKFETYSRIKISDLILKHHSFIWGRNCKTFLGSLYARSLHDEKILFHRPAYKNSIFTPKKWKESFVNRMLNGNTYWKQLHVSSKSLQIWQILTRSRSYKDVLE